MTKRTDETRAALEAVKREGNPSTPHLLEYIADKKKYRNAIAALYCHYLNWDVNWAKVNRAIIKRWSMSGLVYIKRRAWKRHSERKAQLEKEFFEAFPDGIIVNK